MKTSQLAAASAAAIAVSTLVPTRSDAATPAVSTIPSAPGGVLSAYPTIVQTGTKPTLTWNILYPSSIGSPSGGGNGNSGGSGGGNDGSDDLVVVNPPGTLIPQQTVYVTVQIVGTGVTACNSNQSSTSVYTDARVSLNGGSYSQLFYGTQANVNPSKQLYIKKVTANQTIDFGGRYVTNGSWSSFYTTKSSNFQVVALVNGDTPPTTFPLYQSSALANYLKPYLDGAGKVKIGPLSVLIMMELGSANRNTPCFDLQDQVLLATFSTKHPNNGHGNNLDGVDSSNPGQGHGGPNGQVDPSGGVDDEIR
ncbi:MAG: hypothetical protein V4584_05110 [Verrucomicrobiota bacterium]